MRIARSKCFKRLAEAVKEGKISIELDNQGQIIIYSGIYVHSDGSYHDREESKSKKGKHGT